MGNLGNREVQHSLARRRFAIAVREAKILLPRHDLADFAIACSRMEGKLLTEQDIDECMQTTSEPLTYDDLVWRYRDEVNTDDGLTTTESLLRIVTWSVLVFVIGFWLGGHK